MTIYLWSFCDANPELTNDIFQTILLKYLNLMDICLLQGNF